jgi:hypothetical protein
MTIYMEMTASKLLLNILWTEYETTAWENGPQIKRTNMEDGIEAGYTTPEGA